MILQTTSRELIRRFLLALAEDLPTHLGNVVDLRVHRYITLPRIHNWLRVSFDQLVYGNSSVRIMPSVSRSHSLVPDRNASGVFGLIVTFTGTEYGQFVVVEDLVHEAEKLC